MTPKRKHISASVLVIAALLLMNAVILDAAYTEDKKYFWTLLVTVPLMLFVMWSLRRKPADD